MDATIHERIGRIVEEFGDGKNTVIASKLGVSEGNIRGYIKGVMPKQDVLEKIVTYLDVNPEWLLTGKGDMKKEDKKKLNNCENRIKQDKNSIPLIPVNAMAGLFAGEISINDYDCTYYDIPAFRGADFLITVKGDSMRPSFNSGDIVACHKLALSDIFFQWNKVYVLDTNQGALIKRIKPGSDDNHIRIISDNPEYDPFELSKESIYNIALVLGVIKQL